VIEFTVPIEAEATASPVAMVTSVSAPGTPAGLQLPASSQSELTAPVHVDLVMKYLPGINRMAKPARNGDHRALADELPDLQFATRIPRPASGHRRRDRFQVAGYYCEL
jgi:hypothetical protein